MNFFLDLSPSKGLKEKGANQTLVALALAKSIKQAGADKTSCKKFVDTQQFMEFVQICDYIGVSTIPNPPINMDFSEEEFKSWQTGVTLPATVRRTEIVRLLYEEIRRRYPGD